MTAALLRSRGGHAVAAGLLALALLPCRSAAQQADVPPGSDPRIHDIIEAVSADRVEADIRRLVSFGTRNFPGVRIMETHEHYVRQHQDLRTEGGVEYGDVIEWVDFDYAASLTALNAAVLASLAWAPPAPSGVVIGGAVAPAAILAWEPVRHPDLAG